MMMKDFSVMPVYLIVPFSIYSSSVTFRFLHTVITKFFMSQYLQKLHITHRKIKHVDHELDWKIPFRPDKAKIYMEFINIWIRPLCMLLKRFGVRHGSKLCAEFLRYIDLSYREAWKIYSVCMTTTVRPECKSSKAITGIQKADPHYLCVPSLHIAIVCLCFSFYRMLFEREGFTQKEKDTWNKELYEHAVSIGETVLYVKQHSVNCIPAALYMMTRIAPELFTPEMAVTFINDLFKNQKDIPESDRKKINAHMQFTYERFLLEGAATAEDWTEPVLRWLYDYVPFNVKQNVSLRS
ncbi:MAG: hypothetical protein J5780_05130 [Treponema sp.]|nr:hypothetical protein [Treponema sp.]